MSPRYSRPPARKRDVASLTIGTTLLVLGALGAGLLLASRRGSIPETMLQPNSFGPGEKPTEWRSIQGKHWQAQSGLPEEPVAETDRREKTRGACPEGMVEALGKYKLDTAGTDLTGEVERLQDQTCTDWISKEFPARCASFDKAKWLGLSAKLPTKTVHFCVDRFEYPNKRGANPVIVVTYMEAAGMCKAEGKRLCTESEWTYACEGDEATPYATGYDRSSDACVVDQPWKPFAEGALSPRDGERARSELDRLWQGRPSGSRPLCRSSVGVFDMTGNVDEWTRTVRTEGYSSVLKGGYWGPVRARCRPATRAHNEQFVAYQQGFRCCADAPKGGSASPAPAAPAPVSDVASVDAGSVHASPEEADASASAPAAPATVSVPPTAEPAPGPVAKAASLVSAGLDAGALEPDDYDDEAELLRRYKKRMGCANANASVGGEPGTAGGSILLAVAAGLVLRARRRR